MLRFDEYASYDALGLKTLLDTGEISAKELHDIAVNAIEVLNPTLNFLAEASPAEARKALSCIDYEAPFAGIPFLMKDSAGMVGMSSACASRLNQGLKCEKDSELVRRLKRTGVVILGTTNVPEYASNFTTESLVYGPARNPWNLEHSTGGSSGGASSAVAAGVVPMAQSSDGAGSIRVPAHCCGVFGLMPSRGRNPVGPSSYGSGFGITRQHVTTRSVRDSAAMLDQLHGSETGSLYRISSPERPFLNEVGTAPGHLNIAFSTASPSGEQVDSECVAAVEKAARLCRDLGHNVEEAYPSYSWEQFIQGFVVLWTFNFNLIERQARLAGLKIGPETLEKSSLLALKKAKSMSPEQLALVNSQIHNISRQVDSFFERYDVFISPPSLKAAPLLGVLDSNAEDLTSYDMWFDRIISKFAAFTPVFNTSGHPAMSVPLYQSKAGLPIGIHCAARVGEEATLISLASQFERACPWSGRKPVFE